VRASTNRETKQVTVTVKVDDLLRDPAATMRRALSCGRVVIVDALGKTRAVITVPQDTLRVPKF
jgi:nucleoside-triphosphatase THEP1